MNIPKPMTAKNYNKTRLKITDVVKSVVEGTINDVKKAIHKKLIMNRRQARSQEFLRTGEVSAN